MRYEMFNCTFTKFRGRRSLSVHVVVIWRERADGMVKRISSGRRTPNLQYLRRSTRTLGLDLFHIPSQCENIKRTKLGNSIGT